MNVWGVVTQDPNIQSWLQGYTLPFSQRVVQVQAPLEPQWTVSEKKAISEEITHLLNIGAVSECRPEKGQFISSVFLAPKSDGSHRLVLNLKKLNDFIETCHFKMEDRKLASCLITKGCYMATLDLKEAYFLIPVRKSNRKYLRFYFNNKLWEFNCVPFGLCTAPWLFTKIMKPVMAKLRSQGYLSVIYLDDFLLFGDSYESCRENVKNTTKLLEELGFVINHKKSQMIPSQRCKFLGFIYDSNNMTLSLPPQKESKVKALVSRFASNKTCSIRDFAHLCGVLVSVCPGVDYGWLYTKRFEREKFLALQTAKENYDARMHDYRSSLNEDFDWWSKNLNAPSCPIRQFKFKLEIFSDASLNAWGAFCQGQRTHGNWNDAEKMLHINQLELLAAFFALKCFAANLRQAEILLRLDNTTAISYVNRMGGIQFVNLNETARLLWQWCEKRGIWVYASYVSSSDNFIADTESRTLEIETEWELSVNAFSNIVERWGQPNIDLFASRNNKKCRRFISWRRDPEAMAVDAFTMSWKHYFFYAFPPFSIIPRVLKKISTDRARGILVVPYWPAQAWYPLFAKMLTDKPIIFNPNKDLLLSVYRQSHPLWTTLSLVAGRLSGRRSGGKRYL